MSYEPTNWKTGDVVTSAKLNKLEEGVAEASSGGSAGGAYVVEVQRTLDEDDYDEYKCSAKYSELLAAHDAGKLIICKFIDTVQHTDSYINLTARTPNPDGGSVLDVFRFDMFTPSGSSTPAKIQSVWLGGGSTIDSVSAHYYVTQLS